MQCFAAWVCSCDGLCRTQIPRNSLFKLHAWYSWYSTATRLDLHLECYLCRTSLELNASRELEPGPSCMQAGPALRNLAGEHFSLLASRPCVFNLLVVLQFGFRHDRRHAHILTLQGFDHHFSGSVHQFFCACCQQSSLASLSSRSSLGYAEGLQPFCTQIVLAVHLRLATLWQSLIMSMCHMRTEPRLVWLPLLPPWHEPLPKSARVCSIWYTIIYSM